MEHIDLLRLHDRNYIANQTTRERASNDLVFYWVTQWDDKHLTGSNLQYKGEFNIVRKAGRQIMSDMQSNPVQPDFKPNQEDRDDDAELMDGIYRSSDRDLRSQEAYDQARQDQVVCGFGAWEIFTEYANNTSGDNHQVIRREFIPEANNTVFFDASSVRIDKSDARNVSIIRAYTDEGYKEYVSELTGKDRDDIKVSSFAYPEESFTFPWALQNKHVYIGTIYVRKRVERKIYVYLDMFGQEVTYYASEVKGKREWLDDMGYEEVAEKTITQHEVTRYIVDGNDILDEKKVAGQHLPVIPVYGERAIIEGEEHYEGVTRLAKDPQRFRNFLMSYVGDIASRSPRIKPIYLPEQVAGFQDMYEENGAENNYPYLLQNRYPPGGRGEQLPFGPVGHTPEQPVPSSVMTGIDLSRQAVEDVANPGLPKEISDPDVSGVAIQKMQNRIDRQSYIYQHNFKAAKRRDAEVFASMASEIYDTPRKVTIEKADGTRKHVGIMESGITPKGEIKVMNNLTNLDFDVYADIGPSYSSQKEQTIERLSEMVANMQQGDPMRNILMLTLMQMTVGVEMDHVRDFARKQLILNGFKEPETEEDKAMVQQAASQQGQPNEAMVLAQAEMTKAQAMMLREQRQGARDQAEIAGKDRDREIDYFEAETRRKGVETSQIIDMFKASTDRMNTQINAQKIDAEIRTKAIDIFSGRLQRANRLTEANR